MKQVNQKYFLQISVFCHSKPQDGALISQFGGGGGDLFSLLYNI